MPMEQNCTGRTKHLSLHLVKQIGAHFYLVGGEELRFFSSIYRGELPGLGNGKGIAGRKYEN